MRPSPFTTVRAGFEGAFRWYLLEIAAGVFVVGAVISTGFDRLLSLALAVLIGTVAIRLRYGDRSRAAKGARIIQAVVGCALLLGGVGLAGVGVYLATLGSFALLASLVVIPIGCGLGFIGWTMVVTSRTRRRDLDEPNPVDAARIHERIRMRSVQNRSTRP